MKQPKYQVISAQINQLIESGEYPKGSKLPPHRVLAKRLHTTAVTVAKAYQLLVEQRKIASYVGRGSFVLAERLDKVIQASTAPSELNFSILQPCMSLNISALQSLLTANSHRQTSVDLFTYSEYTGLLRHREAGAKWCQQYGLTVESSEDIMLTNGAQNALACIIQLYSKEGDCIAVEAQTYPGVLSICKYLRRRVVAIEMDEQGMLPQALAAQCHIEKPSIVVVVPAQQNPTGATMLKARRQQLASVIEEHQLWLIEDDIYAFLNQQELTPITDLVPDLGFYISSLSKAISPGMRCGYLKVPYSQRLKMSDYIRATLWLASPFMFEFASDAINSGAAFNWAQLQKSKAQQRQELVSQYLHQPMQRQVASYSCWLQLPQRWNATDFTAQAQEKGVIVSDASYFNAANSGYSGCASDADTVNAVRLSVMAVDQDADFVKGLRIIKELVMADPKLKAKS